MAGPATANTAPPPVPQPLPRHRAALAATVVLVVTVLALLPPAARSLVVELLGDPENTLYEVAPDRTIVAVEPGRRTASAIYANVVVAGIDENTRMATLRISGQRACSPSCPAARLVFFALQDDAATRRALPSSAALPLAQNDALLTGTVQLPVRGQPSLYPFDTYQLWIGVVGLVQAPDGAEHPVRPEDLHRNMQITLQADLARLHMKLPTWIEPDRVRAAGDPVSFLYVFGLSFQRPEYLKALSIVLVLLITMSGWLAVLLRPIHDLFLGIGGVILAVWGIRGIIVQETLPYVTAIDLVLSGVILCLLLVLVVRAARHFQRLSGFELPWSRRPPQVVPLSGRGVGAARRRRIRSGAGMRGRDHHALGLRREERIP
jgi:hypothetical protein